MITGPKATLFQNWLNAIWHDGNIEAIKDLLNHDSAAYGHMVESHVALADFEAYVPAMQAIIARTEVQMLRAIETEDWLACVLVVTGQSRATQAEVRFYGQVMARFENGKIIEMYNQFDKAKLLEQLGFLPPETFALMLSGEAEIT